MNELNIGTIKLPLNSATKTFAILAKRGAGKTYTAGVLAEEFYKNSIPFIVIDPIDVWWGLRFNKNGKDKGLPIVVFGVEHSDIVLTRDMGRQIAQAVVADNVSCVISTFGLPKTAQRHLIAELADELLNINNTPRHIFIEEAHEFVPQRVFGELGKTFNAVSNLVVMGRNRGLGVTLINQRAATINKDVLTQLDTLLAFRNVAPQDRKALKEWVEFHSADGNFEKFMQSLPSLPTGEGWIWSPEFLNIFKRIKIRQRETFHPDREKLGSKFEMPRMAQIDVQEFIERFRQKLEQPKKAKLEEKKIIPMKIAEEAFQLAPDFSREFNKLKNEYESKIMEKDSEIRKLHAVVESVQKIIGSSSSSGIIYQANQGSLSMWLDKLGKGSVSKILKFLADNSGSRFTRNQIGLATGLSASSGSFSTYISTLKRNRLVIEEGGYLKVNPDL